MKNRYLTAPQIKAELEKCLQCKSKPCLKACPVGCSPCDYIALAKEGKWDEAAEIIAKENPLGETCGLICPDRFCMKACLRSHIDAPIKITDVQAGIMKKAREAMVENAQEKIVTGKKVAVIGAGPSGAGAVAELIKHGANVEVFEKEGCFGGALNLIPPARLPREVINFEWKRLENNPQVTVHLNTPVEDYSALISQGFDGVIVTIGEQGCRGLGVEGEEYCVPYTQYLRNPQNFVTDGAVAIVGGGAVATDCAVTARANGAKDVEMFVRRRICDMRVTSTEYNELLDNQIDITTMTRVAKVEKDDDLVTAYTVKTRFNADGKLEDVPNTMIPRTGFKYIVLALGGLRPNTDVNNDKIIYAGDCLTGGSTAVEAISAGKSAGKQMAEMLRK